MTRRSFGANGYGRSGGNGPTAGRRAATFLVRLPDGRAEQKRVFNLDAVEAKAVVYQQAGGWHVRGLFTGALPPYVEDGPEGLSIPGPHQRIPAQVVVAERTR